MKVSTGRLTRGRVRLLVRSLGLMGIAFALAGILLMLIPISRSPTFKDIARAATRRFVDYSFLFPKYGELASSRTTPFEFQEVTRVKVKLRIKEVEPEPPPPPKPDVSGLTLVGTAARNKKGLALLHDTQNNKMANISEGDSIRNSIVKEILADKIVVALDAEETEIALAPVAGSENLLRQLRGEPPLPDEQASKPSGSRNTMGLFPHSYPPQSSPSAQSSNNAVLVGGSANSNVMTNSVVGQSAVGSPPSTQRQRPPPPGSAPPSAQGSGINTSSQRSNQSGSTNQSANTGAQNQAPPPPQRGSNSRRSLGISGHMLSLNKQQELGLRETGLLVTSIRNSNSPIQNNDVILSIAGKPFQSLGEARQLLNAVQGAMAQLKILRNGTTIQINAPLN